MARKVLWLFLLAATWASAQTPDSLTLVLPRWEGALTLPLKGFRVTQVSAKPQGFELGVRAHNTGETEVLVFLFETEDAGIENCMKRELDERTKTSGGTLKVEKLESPAGTLRARLAYKNGFQSILGMTGAGEECGVYEIYADKGKNLDLEAAKRWMDGVSFDKNHQPTVAEILLYGNVLYRNNMFEASVPVYRLALGKMPNDYELLQRRVATDNLGMALGMTGHVSEARSVFEKAAATDKEYPLYEYNLACADAEEGKADSARIHLEKAWSLRSGLNSGEPFPNPTQDDSLQKLRSNKAFWTLAQKISSELK